MNTEEIMKRMSRGHGRDNLVQIFKGIENLVLPAYTNVDKGHDLNHIYHVINRGIKIYHKVKETSDRKVFENTFSVCQIELMIVLAGYLHDVYSFTERELHAVKAEWLVESLLKLKNYRLSFDVTSKSKELVEKETMTSIPGQDGTNWTSNTFDWIGHFTPSMLNVVGTMVNEHRASNKNPFTNIFAEIFSAADRDDLNLEVIIGRIYHSKPKNTILFTIDASERVTLIRHLINFKELFNKIVKELTTDYIRKLWDDYEFTNHMTGVFYHLIEKYANGGYMYKKLPLNSVYMKYYRDDLEKFWLDIEDIIDDPSLFIKEYIKLEKKYNN